MHNIFNFLADFCRNIERLMEHCYYFKAVDKNYSIGKSFQINTIFSLLLPSSGAELVAVRLPGCRKLHHSQIFKTPSLQFQGYSPGRVHEGRHSF